MSAPFVLFDLDGTLSDSASGILSSLRAAFDEMGVPWPDEQTARSLLGPPFWHSLPPLVGADRVEEAVARYRVHYVDGEAMFDTALYPGVADVVRDLAGRGVTVAVATSKPEPYAVEIVGRLGLGELFTTVGGDTEDGARDSKAAVIAEVLHRLGDPDPAAGVMVGDRSHDVLGAAAHDLRSVGVEWGYGSHAELTAAGAHAIVTHAAGLARVVSDLLAGTPGTTGTAG